MNREEKTDVGLKNKKMNVEIGYRSICRIVLLAGSCLILFPFVVLGGNDAGRKDTAIHEGFGKFVYTGYKPLSDKPVAVYYYKPDNLPEDAPIMILMHGNSRAAISYRKSMARYAEAHKFLLIVPKFSKKYYRYSRNYHQGGVFNKEGKMKNKKRWTFSIIEPLFDYVKKITGKQNEGYILYGFSAGSQFVHRYTWFFPDNRAIKTITASAGSYTMPDYQVNYPYGLEKTKIPEEHLVKAFAKDYTIVVGGADTVLSRKDLPKSASAREEGRDRVERAMHFYLNAKQMAAEKGVPFRWKFKMIPDVGHSQAQIAGSISSLLFGNKTVL